MQLQAQIKAFFTFKVILKSYNVMMLRLLENIDAVPDFILLRRCHILLLYNLHSHLLPALFMYSFANHTAIKTNAQYLIKFLISNNNNIFFRKIAQVFMVFTNFNFSRIELA
jgi:hypothetical protein